LLDPENQGTPLTFRQVGAGRYRAIAETDEPGVYLTQIAVLDEAGQAIGNLSSGVAVSYSPEYRPGQGPQQGADPLLGELSDTSAGRQSPPPAEAFAPTDQPVGVVQEVGLPLLWLALLLWPLDIASRRLLLRWGDLTFVRERLGRVWQRGDARPTPAPAESTVARLQTARSRARPARAAPERPQPAPERPQPAAPRQPAPEQKPPEKPPAEKRPAPAPRPAEQRAAAQSGEDAVASLLAAKQRARRQRQRAGGEGQDDEAS
jgi:pyruvate/2-oxoglutarate dehydrogenase complex dihydrolipoamide acyltransferase (E2) component